MKTSQIFSAVVALSFAFAASTQAAIIAFDLQGLAGFGLLPGNEPSGTAGNAGSGGEAGAGILFNDVTLQLSINVAWGSANGFQNLTGNASAGHIHGIAANPAPGSFNENNPVIIPLSTLPGWNPSASDGEFVGSVTLTPAQATALTEGRLYLNVHTATNGGGEIRGNLVVPEPSTVALLGFGLAGLCRRRRRA